MKNKITFITIAVMIFLVFMATSAYAVNSNNSIENTNTNSIDSIENTSTNSIDEEKEPETKTRKDLQDFKQIYGETYAIQAFVIDRIRIFSIPVCFLGLMISVIGQHVIGSTKSGIGSGDKGYKWVVTFLTLFVIAQALPLIYAVIVKGWG